MDKLIYWPLLLFWAGLILITKKRRWDLKARVEYYMGVTNEYTSETRVFKAVERLMVLRRRDAMQRELSEGLSYIKNLVVLGRGENMSAELLLEELSDFSRLLAPVYTRMAGHIHVNDKELAGRELYEALGTGYAKDIGEFLAGWEDIPSAELLNTVEIYRSSLREARLTKQKRRDELISDLVYFPVVVNSMVVLLNFIYIAYFIQQREALMLLF